VRFPRLLRNGFQRAVQARYILPRRSRWKGGATSNA